MIRIMWIVDVHRIVLEKFNTNIVVMKISKIKELKLEEIKYNFKIKKVYRKSINKMK